MYLAVSGGIQAVDMEVRVCTYTPVVAHPMMPWITGCVPLLERDYVKCTTLNDGSSVPVTF